MARILGRQNARIVLVLGFLAVLLVAVALLTTRWGAGSETVGAPSGSNGASVRPPTTGSEAPGSPSPESFRRADATMGAMVDARATWHAPDALAVDEPASIGLSIGDTAELRDQIEVNLPGLPVRDGGVLQVGDNVSAELIADRASLAVQPDRAIDASFGSQPGLLWTWTVRPLQPAAKLRVRVHLTMTVPGTDHVMVRDIPLTLPVDRTLSYTAYQVFSSWTTWAAVVASAAAAFGWVRRRQRGRFADMRSGTSGVPDAPNLLGQERDGAVEPRRRHDHADALVETQRTGP